MIMRKQFDRALNELTNLLVEMAKLSEDAMEKSIHALVNQDEEAAKAVITGDSRIDSLEKEIEQKALSIIIKFQPVAADLRSVTTALKMVADIERIADQATDISSITLKMIGQEYCKKIEHIPLMAKNAVKMVNESVKSFINQDIILAKEVIKSDDIVDDMFSEIRDELILHMKKEPDCAEQVIYFMMIAKYIERIGDHAVNIAEWTIFDLTGIHKNSRIL
jgi:phosphate transport system protein